ncbi:MAG: hypothetical protein A2498_01980 [Lentisphaerae bacterium RIFOXYC12_FULL_60_16]|nr:MAG: hypothetical protein A2498_01980 [Lentisphaerae bacterium RIFOXYC12_FULL_60_16]
MNKQRCALGLSILFLPIFALSEAFADSDLKKVCDTARHLMNSGDLTAALAALDQYPLPPPTPTTSWTVSFSNTTVNPILAGRSYGYLLFEINQQTKPTGPLIVPSDNLLIQDSTMGYDNRMMMTCVDFRNGKLLWTRMVPGRMNAALDPETDDLCLWREHLFILDAKTGRLIQDITFKDVPSPDRFDGIMRDGRIILRGPVLKECLRNGRYPRIYDIAQESAREMDAFRQVLTSPDGKKRIFPPLQVREIADGPSSLPTAPLLWQFGGTLSKDPPIWVGDQVVASSGDTQSKGVVRCFDGFKGKERWTFTLPRGLCNPGGYQLRDGTYPPDSWNAVGLLGEHLLALDGNGQIFFLSSTNGHLVARCSLVTQPMHFPVLFEQTLIVSDQQGMRAVPLAEVLNPAVIGPRDIALLRAEIMVRLGQAAAMETTVRSLAVQYPDWPHPWGVLGDIFQALDQPQLELAARCRFLALTGQSSSPRLKEVWGLLKRISLNEEEIMAPVAGFDGKVYCGTKGGNLWAIDAVTLETTHIKEYPAAFKHLAATRQLSSDQGLIREERTNLERPVEPDQLKAFTEMIAGQTVTDNLFLSAAGDDTLAFVRRHFPSATLEIWRRDGSRRLRVETLRYCPNQGVILPLAAGYLVTGDDLIWAPSNEGQKTWCFGARTELPRAVPATHYQGIPNYGMPVIAEGRLFVGCRDGAVYVFDLESITSSGLKEGGVPPHSAMKVATP